jgi:plastocyanin
MTIRRMERIFPTAVLMVISTILIMALPPSSMPGLATGPTPVVAVITISQDSQGNPVFDPQSATIKTGEEILILNNDTVQHTFTNGVGPDDQLAGKLFDTGIIEPGAFVEYVASNLQPGTYPFFSISNPAAKGEIIVTG